MRKKIIDFIGFIVLILFMCHLGYWGALVAGGGVAKFIMFCFIGAGILAQVAARFASDEFIKNWFKHKKDLDIPRLRSTWNYAGIAFILGAVAAYLGMESRDAALDAAMRYRYYR